MAVTIVRTPWIDDDGSGTTGTVLNNAIKTELYNQIDGALAQLVAGSGGLLNITAFGTNKITAGGTGAQVLEVRNTTAGSGNFAMLNLGNDVAANHGQLLVTSSTWTSSGAYLPDALIIESLGTGGLSLAASFGAGAIRFYTGGSTERMRIDEAGGVNINGVSASLTPGRIRSMFDGASQWGIGLLMSSAAPGSFVVFMNASGAIQGSIYGGNSTTVAYQTTSDQRLKEDLGIAEDLTALRAVVVHDFVWSAHGGHDRGVFAQETFPVFPRAVSVGSPGTDLSKPWMTDYSKFVPDLIVGWQEHDRRLARLESLAERT